MNTGSEAGMPGERHWWFGIGTLGEMRSILWVLVILLLSACGHVRTALVPSGDKVNIPMPSGKYGYIIVDQYRMTGYDHVETSGGNKPPEVPYNFGYRNNIFYVLRFDGMEKSDFAGLVEAIETSDSMHMSDAERATSRHFIDKKLGIECGGQSHCPSSRQWPQLMPKEEDKPIPGDPPRGIAEFGLTAEVDSYRAKRKWTSGTIKTGAISTLGRDTVVYSTVYASVYPIDLINPPEGKISKFIPLSVDLGFTANSLWNDLDTKPGDLDDSKLVYGLGYTFEGGDAELFSIHAGWVKGKINGKKRIDNYIGMSVDIAKLLSGASGK